MSQTIPGTFVLGASKTGLVIGYRVLNLDRTTYSAFSTSGVSESAIPGTYYKASGVVAPDAGGYVIVGVSGTDYAEGEIPPAAPTVAAIQSGLSTLTTTDIDNRLAAYDAATGTEAAAILAAIAALNNLSSAGAQAAAAAALAAYDAATGTDVATIAATVAAQNPTPNKAGAITMQRGATFDATLTGLSIPASWTTARLTVKRLSGDSDESAVLQILVSNPGGGSDGLQRVNGTTSGVVAANASLVVNQAAGTVAIHIEDDATILLAAGVYCYDCKIYYGTSDSMATAIATWNVTGIVTAAV